MLLLRDGEGLAVIDDVHRMPELCEFLAPISDAPKRKTVFLLLGSAFVDFVKSISEAPAGRIRLIDVNGFSPSESGQQDRSRLWCRGGFQRAYPAPSAKAYTRWMGSLTRTSSASETIGRGPVETGRNLFLAADRRM